MPLVAPVVKTGNPFLDTLYAPDVPLPTPATIRYAGPISRMLGELLKGHDNPAFRATYQAAQRVPKEILLRRVRSEGPGWLGMTYPDRVPIEARVVPREVLRGAADNPYRKLQSLAGTTAHELLHGVRAASPEAWARVLGKVEGRVPPRSLVPNWMWEHYGPYLTLPGWAQRRFPIPDLMRQESLIRMLLQEEPFERAIDPKVAARLIGTVVP